MGIIQKQSISGTIYSYIGVSLGFLTTAILYPRIFTTEEVGLFRILVSYSILFSQFAGLGVTSITVKIFPYFRDHAKKHHGFLGLALLITFIGLIIAILSFILLKEDILNGKDGKNDLFSVYFYYIIPLIIFTLLFNVFDTYYRVLYNAVKGIIYKEVIQRILILIIIALYFFEVIDFHNAVILYCIALISPSFMLLISLVYNKQLFISPDFNFLDKKLINEIALVGFFGIVSSYSGVLVMMIDTIMVQKLMGLSAAGIYSITFFFGALILIPFRTMGKISGVIISDAWKENDISLISNIYKKSSISLTVLGLLLLVGIWGNIDNIYHILPPEYLSGKYVILIIGLANLIDISLGVSSQIIANSKHYRFLSYFLIIYATLIIVTNLILIPIYGIIGAAIATLISKLIYTLIKYIFLYNKYKLQPFTIKTVILYLIGIIAYGASFLLPEQSNFIVDIIIRSIIITVVFIIPVYYLKISEDINDKIDSTIKKLVAKS